jgi:hypothetical protein
MAMSSFQRSIIPSLETMINDAYRASTVFESVCAPAGRSNARFFLKSLALAWMGTEFVLALSKDSMSV